MSSMRPIPLSRDEHDACYEGDRLLTVDQALEQILVGVEAIGGMEVLALHACLGRVLATDITAAIDVPGSDNSGVDGYAVCSADTCDEGTVTLAIAQRVAAGQVGTPLARGTAARIFTGAPLPVGADAVAMQENCEREGARVRLRVSLRPGDNVRPHGQNLRAGSLVLSAGRRLRPQDLGVAASQGMSTLPVRRRLRVAVLSTGDELVPPGQSLAPGQSYTANNAMLCALLAGLGCEILDLGIVADDFVCTCRVLKAAGAQTDLVISSGGVSVGEEDHVRSALETTGSLRLWRIAMRPGKPLAFGQIGNARFLGLPGNPVSTLATFLLFARPLILRLFGANDISPVAFEVEAGFERSKTQSRREFARARLEMHDGRSVAVLHPNQSSDVLSSAVWADGLVEFPEGTTVTRGQLVRYLPFCGLLS